MQDLASALSNDTTHVISDVSAMFLLEKQISRVRSRPSDSALDSLASIVQYHWTNAEQRLRDNETIRTTVGNLSNALISNVGLSLPSHHALSIETLVSSLTSPVIFVSRIFWATSR